MASNHFDAFAPSQLLIDLGAIQRNYRRLCQELGTVDCAAVVKANGYGLGATRVVETLIKAGAKNFFFAHLAEALEVRDSIQIGNFYVFNGLGPKEEAAYLDQNITPVLNDLSQLKRWIEFAEQQGTPLHAALNIDTGMSRLGLCQTEVQQLIADPEEFKKLNDPLILSHLCSADDIESPSNAAQLAEFRQVTARLPKARLSFANSSGTFRGKEYHFDLGRPGVALYGVNPTPETTNPMEPVVTVRCRVLQTRTIPSGRSVGYGCTFVSDKETKIATIALGYADGYLRVRGRRSSVVINGKKADIIGRVSMDAVTVDVSDFNEEDVHTGSFVSVIDAVHDVDKQAREVGTIGYEVLTNLGRRYARVYQEPN